MSQTIRSTTCISIIIMCNRKYIIGIYLPIIRHDDPSARNHLTLYALDFFLVIIIIDLMQRTIIFNNVFFDRRMYSYRRKCHITILYSAVKLPK